MPSETTSPAMPHVVPTLGAPDLGRTLAGAQQNLAAVKTAHNAALMQLKKAGWLRRYHLIRLWPVRRGIPDWVIPLFAGSLLAIIFATLLIIIGAGLGAVFAAVAFSYLVCCAGTLWLLRSLNGETEANRLDVREQQVKLAKENEGRVFARIHEIALTVEKAEQHVRAIQQELRSEAYKHQAETNRLLAIEPGRLYPEEFEHHVAEIFRHLGFAVQQTGQSGDQGVDVLASKNELRLAIQAKRYLGSVGNSAVQEVFAGMAHYKCHRCMVVTTGDFTSGALALAQSTGCLLIGAEKIGPLIRGEINF